MKHKLYFVLLMLYVLTGLSDCTKEEPEMKPPEESHYLPIVVTDTVVIILTPKNAVLGFKITDIGGAPISAKGICWSTSKNPTINDNKYEAGGHLLAVSQCYISGLVKNTTYYVRAFATNSVGTAYGNEISFTTPVSIFNQDLTYGSVSDIDGNLYKTIKIGTQTWMAENLRTTKYNDGSNRLEIYYDSAGSNPYGGLYDWYTVNLGKLCPTGWHVPCDEEWKQLEMALGMSKASSDTCWIDDEKFSYGFRGTDQGSQLKATIGWITMEGKGGYGTNTSGFSALPAGETDCRGIYYPGGSRYWCFGDPPIARILEAGESGVSRGVYDKRYGFSIRCVKD